MSPDLFQLASTLEKKKEGLCILGDKRLTSFIPKTIILMIKIPVEVMRNKLAQLPIDQLIHQSGFCSRTPMKASGQHLLMGFFLLLLQERFSLRSWASKVSLLIGKTFSKQGLFKRITPAHATFAEQLLSQALVQHYQPLQIKYSELLSPFKRVLLQDSTTLLLPDHLVEVFAGNVSKGVKKAVARVQQIYELLSGCCLHLHLTAYTDNDQKAAGLPLPYLQQGDLLLRDLGYFSLPVLQKVIDQKAFFLTRLPYGVNLYEPCGVALDLLQQLKGQSSIDLSCLVGSQAQLPLRLIALRLPDSLASERRRKAKQNRDGRWQQHSQAYLDRLDYAIFITNIPATIWGVEQVAQVYRLRWRIEILFKCWKSHFRLAYLLKQHIMNQHMVKIAIYYTLLFITLFLLHWYRALLWQCTQPVSLVKLAAFLQENLALLLQEESIVEKLYPQISYYCRYEKRRKRKNFYQLLYLS